MRRLYIGGLSHSVTQKDLKDRFGKFGEVQDVEIRTRRDDEGVPYKTFGYININISEADLKKCLTVLNKSKWKGGTLQIETAKESFLQRLTQERQAAVEQRLQQPAAEDKRQKMLDSLSKAGVDNFTMKAAVPGTEVPGHKDWVVSKFGRVLPILQLKNQKGTRARTLKYDPSKYSHNIRKLDRIAADEPTPITKLTWEVQGGDDDISKKRRGEFPPYEPPRRKKSRTDVLKSHNAVGRTRLEQTQHSVDFTVAQHSSNGFEPSTNSRPTQRTLAPFFDSDVDSDEEIRRLVAAQNHSSGALCQEEEEDNLEVVGLDYLVKSGHSQQQQKGGRDDKDEDDYDSADTDELFASRKPPPPSAAPMEKQEKQTLPPAEYLSGNNRKKKTKKKGKTGAEEEEEDSADTEERITPRKPLRAQQRGDSQKRGGSSDNQCKKTAVLPFIKSPFSESDEDEDEDDDNEDGDEGEEEDKDADDEELESADSCSDSDYEAMFSNVTRLEISFADLQRLAEQSQQTSETTVPSILSTSPEKVTNSISDSAEQPAPKKGNMPEEILASIMEDESSDDEKKKKKKRKIVMSAPLPAFQGTKTLSEDLETNAVKKHKLDSEELQSPAAISESSEQEEEEEEEEEEGKREVKKNIAAVTVFEKVPNKAPVNTEKAESSSSSSSDDDEMEEEKERMKASLALLSAKVTAQALPSSSSSSTEEDDDEQEVISAEDVGKTATPPAPHVSSSSSEEEDEEAEEPVPSQVTLRAEEEVEQQKKANMRRLAAIQQRLKEAEEHKKLIQGALANLDTPTAGAGKHIVFGSDEEEEEEDGESEDKQPKPSEVTVSKKTLFQDSQSEDEASSDDAASNKNNTVKEKVCLKLSGPQLFGGSEDEEDGEEEEDGGRFDIRPQFEGRAGQKLMELQSRFGTDERFRMDSRFLEEDEGKDEEPERKKCVMEEDEGLEEERKKNLSILQSVLGSSQQTCSGKTTSKAKTFRDVSALHYDPSREEHAAFETKPDETKESKSARRKKREEAQKLPEVSKEIYYDVSGDLKAVFGSAKDDITEEEEKTSWDQEEEEERGEKEAAALPSSFVSANPSAEKEESGFKFSFFGDDTETEQETEYKVESIQASKVSWQQDPRFQDSSSEEDEEGQEEDEEQSSAMPLSKTAEEATLSKTNLFFFYPEDSRLTEGPRLFCRSSQLEEQREHWEERRSELRQEYRKKHKDARRKLKSSLKS